MALSEQFGEAKAVSDADIMAAVKELVEALARRGRSKARHISYVTHCFQNSTWTAPAMADAAHKARASSASDLMSRGVAVAAFLRAARKFGRFSFVSGRERTVNRSPSAASST
jgi:hypothetical protein